MGRLSSDCFDTAPAPMRVADAVALIRQRLPVLAGIETVPLAQADLSPAARAFYSENRRVANGKAKRLLGWALRYPDYRFGLRALSATTSPASASSAPAAASADQR